MKIEQLTFSNINSLAGEFEIDFTNPSLEDSGLFVITGPTGSGKTTLLDAISFALYGCTPRQKAINNNNGELISRKASRCCARVILQKDGKRYLIGSAQRRNRNNKHDTPCTREFHELDDENKTFNSESSKREIDKKVEALTGLDVDNFQRCMLLAQGEFAKFLKSTDSERAEVLSTITQTGIYLKIGEEVQAKVAKGEKDLAGLGDEPKPLAEEARSALERACEELSAQAKAKNDFITLLNNQVNHLEQIARVSKKQAESKEKLTAAQQASDAFQQDGRAALLNDAERANKLRPAWVLLSNTRKELATQQGAKEQLLTELPPLQKAREAAEAALLAATREKDETEARCEAGLKRLDELVIPKEKELTAQSQVCKEASKTLKQASDRYTSAEKEKLKREQELATAESALQEAQENYRKHAQAQPLVEKIAVLQARLQDWENADGADAELPPSEQLQQRSQELATRRETLLRGVDESTLPRRQLLLTELIKQSETQAKVHIELAECREKISACAASIAELEPKKAAAEKQVEASLEIQDLCRAQADIQEQLDSLYQKFAEGKLPVCPCCGSEKPGKRHIVTNSILKDAEDRTQAAKATLGELEKELLEVTKEHHRKAAQEKVLEPQLSDTQTRLSEILMELGMESSPEQPELLLKEVQETIESLKQLQTEEQALAAAHQLDTLRRALHRELINCGEQLPLQLTAAREQVRTLARRACDFQTAEATQTKALTARNTAKSTLEAAQKTTNERRKEQTEAAEALNQASDRLEALQREFHQLWPHEESTGDAKNRLNRENLQAHQKASTAAAQQQKAAGNLQEAQNKLKTVEENISRYTNDQATQTADFNEQLAAQKFESEEAYHTACTALPQLEALRSTLKALDRALTEARSTHEGYQHQLEELRKSELNVPETTEVLKEKIEEATTNCAELQDELAGKKADIINDDKTLELRKAYLARKAEVCAELEQWEKLYKLLGNSKESFQRYAQQLTLRRLVAEANKQLALLTDRFILQHDNSTKSGLGLAVIDRYLDVSTPRKCSNLSGGESFIISLALALGLSRVNGDTRIDTLFLDEGFGTLDKQTLSQVISSLEQLRTQGKLIGIISHVQELSEAIPQNIRVEPIGNSGYSTLDKTHPAVKASPM